MLIWFNMFVQSKGQNEQIMAECQVNIDFYATIKIPLKLEALIPRIGRCWKTLWHRYWQKPMVSTCFNMSPLVNFLLNLNPLIQAILDRPSEAPSAELLVMQTRRVG